MGSTVSNVSQTYSLVLRIIVELSSSILLGEDARELNRAEGAGTC